MFNPTTFTVAHKRVWTSLRECHAVVDGKHPLDGWRCKAAGLTDVAHNPATKVTLLMSHCDNDDGRGEFFVTAYYGANPQELYEMVLRKRAWGDLSGNYDVDDGGQYTEHDLFCFVAQGAPLDFRRPSCL
jgi:hypothetical protein